MKVVTASILDRKALVTASALERCRPDFTLHVSQAYMWDGINFCINWCSRMQSSLFYLWSVLCGFASYFRQTL